MESFLVDPSRTGNGRLLPVLVLELQDSSFADSCSLMHGSLGGRARSCCSCIAPVLGSRVRVSGRFSEFYPRRRGEGTIQAESEHFIRWDFNYFRTSG